MNSCWPVPMALISPFISGCFGSNWESVAAWNLLVTAEKSMVVLVKYLKPKKPVTVNSIKRMVERIMSRVLLAGIVSVIF